MNKWLVLLIGTPAAVLLFLLAWLWGGGVVWAQSPDTCGQWHWHVLVVDRAYRLANWDDASLQDMAGDYYGSYPKAQWAFRSEQEAIDTVCATIEEINAGGRKNVARINGELYEVAPFLDDSGSCRRAEPDGDMDGVRDGKDECPYTERGIAVSRYDGCACESAGQNTVPEPADGQVVAVPEPDDEQPVIVDRDEDGIPDDEDACPQQYADTWDGCPPPTATPTVNEAVTEWMVLGGGLPEDIHGWERLTPDQQDRVRTLADKLGLLAEQSQLPGGSTVSQDLMPKLPIERRAIQQNDVVLILEQQMRDRKAIIEKVNTARYLRSWGDLYKVVRATQNLIKPAYDRAKEWTQKLSDPKQAAVQALQDWQKQKLSDAAKKVLQDEGVLYGDGTQFPTEYDLAQAVYEWTEQNTAAAAIIHYGYYRRVFDDSVKQGHSPEQAHARAIEALKRELESPSDDALAADAQPGRLAKAWGHPHYSDWDVYGTVFLDLNGEITAPGTIY